MPERETGARSLRMSVMNVRLRMQQWVNALTVWLQSLQQYRWVRPVVDFASSFTRLAWGLLATGLFMLFVGMSLSWTEMTLPGAASVAMVAVALLLSIRSFYCDVSLNLSHDRVTVGELISGEIVLEAKGSRGTRPLQVLFPVGGQRVSLWTPRLSHGETFEEPFLISTSRRGKIQVGPAQAVRSDGLGIIRRVQSRSQALEVFVHPRTVNVAAQVLGFIRDIEGLTTQDLSSSDVSFRALRDYLPGDDRRSIHWKTTARVGKMMVRQFEETRRAHLLVVIDLAQTSWKTAEDFEEGISVAASLVRAAYEQSIHVDVYTTQGAIRAASRVRLLDELSLVDECRETIPLKELVRRATVAVPQASVCVTVTGSGVEFGEVLAVTASTGADLLHVAVRVDKDEEAAVRTVERNFVLHVPTVEYLPRMLNRVLA